METHITVQLVSMVASVAGATAWLTWFIRNQLSENRRLFYRVISQHNREDDDRFAILDDQIWRIHMRNARRDGDDPPEREVITRRRYLLDDGEEHAPAPAE